MTKLYTYEMKLVSADAFGPVSSMQRPDRVVGTGQWKAVGLLSKNHSDFVVLQRRRWFWMREDSAAHAKARMAHA